MFIDSHAHINFPNFDKDRDKVVERARASDIDYILNIGVDLPNSRESIRLAEKHDLIYAAVGIHPHDAVNVPSDYLKELEAMLQHPKVVAVGEIGLDFYRNYSPRDIQRKILLDQLQLAVATNLPVIVHTRNAWSEILDIFQGEFKGKLKGVFHCFSGDEKIARRVLEFGFNISFTGVVTFKNARALEVAKTVPIDRLLLETDCPFMAPFPYRGKRCEPAYIPIIADKIAEAKGCDEKVVAKKTSENVKRLFSRLCSG